MNLLYTFNAWNNKSFKIVRNIDLLDTEKMFIRDTMKLAEEVRNKKYKKIIGLGDYQKNANNIRVETKYINKYGKNVIVQGGIEVYTSNWSPQVSMFSYLADKPSNGPCNKSAYLVMREITEAGLNTKYTFLHIPRNYKIELASEYIQKIFEE